MRRLRTLTLVIMLVAAVPALAQEHTGGEPAVGPVTAKDPEAAPAEDSQESPKLVEPARTLKEALERRSAEEAKAAADLEAARKAFDERMAAANQRTVADLTVIARRDVAEGELASAAKAWEEVLRLDPENEGAKAFFRTIGRLDEVQKRLAKIPGDDRRVWQASDSGLHRFVRQSDGTWLQILPSGERKPWKESWRTEHTIELERPDGAMRRLHRDRLYWSSSEGGWRSGVSGSWHSDR